MISSCSVAEGVRQSTIQGPGRLLFKQCLQGQSRRVDQGQCVACLNSGQYMLGSLDMARADECVRLMSVSAHLYTGWWCGGPHRQMNPLHLGRPPKPLPAPSGAASPRVSPAPCNTQ